MATLRDIAERIGVSVSEVSRVLNGNERAGRRVSESTRNRILELAEEMGYEPNVLARSLVTKRTNILGALIYSIEHPYFATLLSHLENAARLAGYQLLTCTRGFAGKDLPSEAVRETEHQHLRLMGQYSVDGIIFCNWENLGEDSLQQLPTGITSTPMVAMGYVEEATQVDAVTVDLSRGAALAIEHLIALGHRKIAYAGQDADGGRLSYSRFTGYIETMQRNGLSPQPFICRDPGLEGGYAFGKYLASLDDRPTGILLYSDFFAMGAFKGLYESGIRVPQDLSLVSCDGLTLARYWPVSFTTIQTPFEELCAETVRLVTAHIDHMQATESPRSRQTLAGRRVIINPELSIGESTAAPPI